MKREILFKEIKKLNLIKTKEKNKKKKIKF
jgi:hypothetical protein